MPHPGFERAQRYFGSVAAMAEALQISRVAVYKMRFTGLNARRALQVERLSNGALRAVDLAGQEVQDQPQAAE